MAKAARAWSLLFALFCCGCVALAPILAEARAGSSYGKGPSSFGSRGVRSWENNGAQPPNRAAAPQTSGPNFGAGMPPGAGTSFIQRHPFLTGLAGGVLGSWLFGHMANAEGAGAAGSMLGTLLWLALIGFLIWFAIRFFRARAVSNGWPGRFTAERMATITGRASPFRGRDVNLSDADLEAFQRLHAAIQDAWSAGDLGRMRGLMTPEMLSHFSQELSRNTDRGLRNVVNNVQLVQGELSEAWDEGDRQYATAFLRWRAVDYMLPLAAAPGDPTAVVGGDPHTPAEYEEVWTFVRHRGGGWLLSAIQQV
jgi:predicted lipid-binding transport protein (Tim44 family)